jgi:hypothetical protein
MTPPAKFNPKQRGPKSKADIRASALVRLQNLRKLANEDGEWNPEGEPVVSPMLEAVEGGIDHCIRALRAHDDEDARAFLNIWDRCTAAERKHLSIEEIAHASGIGSLRLAEIVQTALFLYGNMQTQMMLAAGLPAVVAQSLKQARTKKGYVDREWMLRAGKILPVPKGAQTAIQINTGEAGPKQFPEGAHEWKYPEDRLKEIVSVLNPKQLESGNSTGELIHFDQNKPTVFER